MKLSELKPGESGIIVKVKGRGAFRKRIIEMGFIKGKEVKVIRSAPLGDPIEYSLMGYNVSLRKSEADLIEIVSVDEFKTDQSKFHSHSAIYENVEFKNEIEKRERIINIALVGNPNSGKTTFYNQVTGSREKVANYPGVTVDSKTSIIEFNGYTLVITDLPGTYSLSTYSPEEVFVRDYIIENLPDIIINIVDATNLERNLYLTTQLIDLDVKIVVALNMYDELLRNQDILDYIKLGTLLGIPFVPTISNKNKGIKELLQTVIDVYLDENPISRHIHVNYGKEIEESIERVQKYIKIPENFNLTDKLSSRFLAIKLLEKDKDIRKFLNIASNKNEILEVASKEISRLEYEFHSDCESILAEARYGFISGALKETYNPNVNKKFSVNEVIDTIVTHKLFGFPIFLFIIWLMFSLTFKLGKYPTELIEKIVNYFAYVLEGLPLSDILSSLLVDGIINGVGSVLVFLPNILLLFFFISILEDTGYMARTAFIMDKLMHRIGLHGKSFIPLLMGFGCNVPAIMATRIIESRKNRIITMLIVPFMSCSARLPVYVLIVSAVFSKSQGTILFLIYLTGLIISAITSFILKKLFFKTDDLPFVMELPPYRVPTLKCILKDMWFKSAQYLKKMSTVILLASIIIWFLNYFPLNKNLSVDYDKEIQSLLQEKEKLSITNSISNEKAISYLDSIISQLKTKKFFEEKENSYIGKIGKFIEPAIAPLGFDWRIGVSLLTGISAKEVVVSTLSIMFHSEDNEISLQKRLKEVKYESTKYIGKKMFTVPMALAFLVFVLTYTPCIATLTVISKESGSWKWAAFSFFYSLTVAWILSFLVFNIGKLIINI